MAHRVFFNTSQNKTACNKTACIHFNRISNKLSMSITVQIILDLFITNPPKV